MELNERDWRWNRVRAEMRARKIGLLIVLPESDPTDVLYLAGEIGAVLFPLEKDPTIVLGGENTAVANGGAAWIADRQPALVHASNKIPYGAVLAERLRRNCYGPGRVALAGMKGNEYSHVRSAEGYLLYTSAMEILEALGDTEVVDGAPVMAAARHVKSETQIDALRAAVAVAESGARAIGEAFAVRAEQADAYRAGMTAMMRPGLALPTLAWCPGTWGHPRPRLVGVPSGAIEAGLCVAAEIILPVAGGMAQIAEPYVAGTINAEQHAEFELNIAAFEVACKTMVPGTPWREVRRAVSNVAAGTGYTLALLLHGGWDGPLFLPNEVPGEVLDDPVQGGAVFICKPTAWPAATGAFNARSHDASWGDMVVVRDNGAERLGTRAPQLVAY